MPQPSPWQTKTLSAVFWIGTGRDCQSVCQMTAVKQAVCCKAVVRRHLCALSDNRQSHCTNVAKLFSCYRKSTDSDVGFLTESGTDVRRWGCLKGCTPLHVRKKRPRRSTTPWSYVYTRMKRRLCWVCVVLYADGSVGRCNTYTSC